MLDKFTSLCLLLLAGEHRPLTNILLRILSWIILRSRYSFVVYRAFKPLQKYNSMKICNLIPKYHTGKNYNNGDCYQHYYYYHYYYYGIIWSRLNYLYLFTNLHSNVSTRWHELEDRVVINMIISVVNIEELYQELYL